MAFEILGHPELASDFISAWRDSSPVIEARTSGSTGVPKAILLRKADMEASAKATNAFFNIGSASILALPLSCDYIAGKMMIVRAMVAGCKLWIEPPSLTPFIYAPEFSLGAIVPAQLDSMLQDLSLIRKADALLIGGAPLSCTLEKQLANLHCRAFVTYGMTETCSHVAIRRCGDENGYSALPGITFSTDSRGCLIIHSNSFSFTPLVTNDIVDLLSPVSFKWLGRADNVINTGGIKVCAEEIEALVRALIGDRRFYVCGTPSEKWGTQITLVVEGTDFNEKAFFEEASSRIPHRLLPKTVILKDKISVTENGKIRRGEH